MEADRLIYMANQIAMFFQSYPEEQAIAATVDHLLKFWDPRMRKELASIVEKGGEGLSAIALAAARQIAAAAPPSVRAE